MPTFAYTAVDTKGKQQTGTITAGDAADATAKVKKLGVFPTSVKQMADATPSTSGTVPTRKKEMSFSLGFGGGRVNARTLTVFTRQLATLIDAGLPLLRGLKTLVRQEKNVTLRETMNSLATAIESGSTFSEGLAQHPKIFNKLYVNMVKAGEIGGVLEVVLKRLADFMEKAQKIKGKVVSALVYPVVVLIIAMLIVAFLMLFIVPRFKQIFSEMLPPGTELPFVTQLVIAISERLFSWTWPIPYIPMGIVAVVVGAKVFASTTFGADFIDNLKLKMPVFGRLMTMTSIARFTRTLGTLVQSGVPILQALNITKETAGNVRVSDAIAKVHERVKEGESMTIPLEQSGIFPPMVISMIQVGEETGKLPAMLEKVADIYEDEVDVAVNGLTSMLEPIMIVLLAVIVGTIVVALFLPLMKIITVMSSGGGG